MTKLQKNGVLPWDGGKIIGATYKLPEILLVISKPIEDKKNKRIELTVEERLFRTATLIKKGNLLFFEGRKVVPIPEKKNSYKTSKGKYEFHIPKNHFNKK